MIRTYSELIKLPTFIERYHYLKLNGQVGVDTFGYDRYLNQVLYHSQDWKTVRRNVIVRDQGCDLGIEEREITGRIIIHHLNPITLEDIYKRKEEILNPEYLICVSHDTHNAIHYGDESLLFLGLNERMANDTCPWR